MEKHFNITTILIKVLATLIIVALGGVFLFPEHTLRVVPEKIVDAIDNDSEIRVIEENIVPVSTPKSSYWGNSTNDKSSKKSLLTKDSEVFYHSRMFFGSSMDLAKKEVDSQMLAENFTKIELDNQELALYKKGEKMSIVRFSLKNNSPYALFMDVESKENSPATNFNLSADIKDILLGDIYLLFETSEHSKIVTTTFDYQLKLAAEKQRLLFQKMGWVILDLGDFKDENLSDSIVINARKGGAECSAVFSPANETISHNIITYKFILE